MSHRIIHIDIDIKSPVAHGISLADLKEYITALVMDPTYGHPLSLAIDIHEESDVPQ